MFWYSRCFQKRTALKAAPSQLLREATVRYHTSNGFEADRGIMRYCRMSERLVCGGGRGGGLKLQEARY